jgi:programmed cell death protein 4
LDFAQILIDKNNGLELDMVWGVGGGLRPVRILSEKIDLLIQEFFSSADKAEAERCLVSLGVPHFHHELVYTLLIQTSEQKEHEVL